MLCLSFLQSRSHSLLDVDLLNLVTPETLIREYARGVHFGSIQDEHNPVSILISLDISMLISVV